jgi:hypothetical protein
MPPFRPRVGTLSRSVRGHRRATIGIVRRAI